MPNHLKIFLSISSFFLLFSSGAFALSDNRGGAELLNKQGYAVGIKGSLFQTTSYFDFEGSEIEMAEGSDYKLMDLDFSVSYGVTNSLELTGLGRFRSVTSNANSTSVSNNGIESIGLLAKYAFTPIGSARYAVGVHYAQTLYDNTLYGTAAQVPADEVILGDSGSKYGINLYFTYLNQSLRWDAQFGYNNPGNDLSEELVYKFQAQYLFTRLAFLAGVEGINSLKTDQFSETPLLRPLQAVGASRQFSSVNREIVQPFIGTIYAFDSFLLSLKGASIIKGVSTDRGNRVELAINWATQGITKESLKVAAFKEYIIEGSVLKLSARGNFLRIDQGLSTDVEKGMKFDIYQTDYFGGNVLVAFGIVFEVGSDWSVIKITKKYKEIEIKPGFAARGF